MMKTYQCSLCGMSFESAFVLRVHVCTVRVRCDCENCIDGMDS